VLSIVNAVLDKRDWSASRSGRCKPGEGDLCTSRWALELA